MLNLTYYVVVPFSRDGDSMVVPGEGKETTKGETARRRVAITAAAASSIGAVAFQRTGPDTCEFQKGVVLASVGAVDLDALQG